MTAVLGYPLYKLVTLSFQLYQLPQLIQRQGEWIGLDNYERLIGVLKEKTGKTREELEEAIGE